MAATRSRGWRCASGRGAAGSGEEFHSCGRLAQAGCDPGADGIRVCLGVRVRPGGGGRLSPWSRCRFEHLPAAQANGTSLGCDERWSGHDQGDSEIQASARSAECVGRDADGFGGVGCEGGRCGRSGAAERELDLGDRGLARCRCGLGRGRVPDGKRECR